MDYGLLLNEILNIGEEMLRSGAEVDRVEDSMYRMCKSYDIEQCNIFAIQSNIQATIRPTGGSHITQIRRIRSTSFYYERLDYLNNLSRYICQHKPSVEEVHERYVEVMDRKQPAWYLSYLAAIMGGVGFGVYFGCDFADMLTGTVICAFAVVWAGSWLSAREQNLVVYNMIISFLSSVLALLAADAGFGNHPDRIILGLSMVLVSGLGTTNGIRDLLDRNIISGIVNIANALLGAVAIACGIGLSMVLVGGEMYEMYIAPSLAVQLISCGVASAGFALFFKAELRQSVSAGIGGLLNCACYIAVLAFFGNSFAAVLAGAVFVAAYSYVMSRVHRAPATIFLTTSIMPIIPGATLFYMMHGFVQADYAQAAQQAITLVETGLAIAFGFMIVGIVTRYVGRLSRAIN